MNEQDLKYLIASYQQKSFDLFSQSIANDAKIRQLNDLVEALNNKVKEQQEELDKLNSKPKRTTKSDTGDF
jgi:peptidoglycan hydrolase CwlO-like protein